MKKPAQRETEQRPLRSDYGIAYRGETYPAGQLRVKWVEPCGALTLFVLPQNQWHLDLLLRDLSARRIECEVEASVWVKV